MDKQTRRTGDGRLLSGRPAPTCMVRFRCKECGVETIEDAFLGAIICMCEKPHGTPMEAISVVRDVVTQGYHPDSTQKMMAGKNFRGEKIEDNDG